MYDEKLFEKLIAIVNNLFKIWLERSIGVDIKRKSKGFSGVPKWLSDEDQPVGASCIEKDQPSTSMCSNESSQEISDPIGASRHKLCDRGFSNSNNSSSESDMENEEHDETQSYRLIDVNLLSSTLTDVHKCPKGLFPFKCRFLLNYFVRLKIITLLISLLLQL